ncbi:hypothetical protein [Hyperthermus butylicus]|uniref:Uncharacterized protein n=1 Tax=Hyperthermus butylicus (strain DSM 5456 / JCM 9403 / PLM1-5) TaxID=415426 RepID=A2BMV2_HYPBU|nr:hypothetical protein [Hyperthermus butylicus]ABM81313.1 hypothetical protein Hbut_1491 [Hyperthermus butylicus DSM 5456]
MEADSIARIAHGFAVPTAALALLVLAYTVLPAPWLLAGMAVAAAAAAVGRLWLSLLTALSVALTAAAVESRPETVAALAGIALLTLAAPGPGLQPPYKPPKSLLLAIAFSGLAALHASLAAHALAMVQPYAAILASHPGAEGSAYLAAALVAAAISYLASAPRPLLRPPSRLRPWHILEVVVYTATMIPVFSEPAVFAAVLAGLAAGGIAVQVKPRARLVAYMAAYTAAALLLGVDAEIARILAP